MARGKIIVRLTDREAQELLGHSAASKRESASMSGKRFYSELENKVRKAYEKKLRSI